MESDRQLHALRDLGGIVTGKTPKTAVENYFNGVTPFITPTDFDGRRWIEKTLRTLTSSGVDAVRSSLIPAKSVMVTCIGSDMGKVAMSAVASVTNQQINTLVINPEHEALYVYYNLLGRRTELRTLAAGSAQPILNKSSFGMIEIELPTWSEQRAVADILSALDDRIDFLRQTNTTLEAIAQALFKSWFVDFDPVRAKAEGREPEAAAQRSASGAGGRMPGAPMDAATAALFPSEFEASELGLIPKGWRAGRLGDISSNPRDQAKPGKIDPDTPYFGLEHMPRKSIALGDHGTADGLGSGKFWFEESDILFGKLRPYFHKVGLAPFKGICSTDILVLRPAKTVFHALLLTHASSDAIIGYATRLSNGAKMPRSSWKDIAGYPICIPPDFAAQVFNEAVEPMFERIKANVRAASALAQLRDTLLPRLISGKLRLLDAGREVEAIA